MSNHLRKYILITLSHAEKEDRQFYTGHFITAKIRSVFNCQAIVVAKERHKTKGYHFHVGVLNDNASSHTATKKIRNLFLEFDGSQCNVSFHRSFNSICTYILKQDENPHCWNITLDECRERAHRQKKGKRNVDSLSELAKCENWIDVVTHPKFHSQVLRSYTSVKQTWMDVHLSRQLPTLAERLQEYVFLYEKQTGKQVEPYTPAEVGGLKETMDWLGANLDTHRPIRTPQLLMVGPPGSGKSTFISQLQEFLQTYVVPMRKDDFSRATTNVDLWVIDEFKTDRMSGGVLNAVLDGQRVALDCKYGLVFYKDKNIPIVLLAHDLPEFPGLQNKAFFTRVRVTKLLGGDFLETERIAKTLLDVLEERTAQKLPSGFLLIPSTKS